MIDTEALRKKVIDLAIQGKLTDQLPEDGDARNLYAQIQEEKGKLVKEGKIKKQKALPLIEDNEIPFEIPKNWMWVRWGDLSEKIQYGYNAPAKENGRILMVRISDIQNGKVQWENVPYCEIDEQNIEEYLLRENDILFARTGATVGKSFIVSELPEESVFAGYLIRSSYSSRINATYIKLFMDSSLYWKQLRNGTTAMAQPNCNGKTLSKMYLPLPTSAEQDRIVEVIDGIVSAIDTIEELQFQYYSDSEILKSKIIDAGIHGRLTKQLPEDGAAEELYVKIQEEKKRLIKEGKIKKQKPLPEITEDEIPFDIPSNWKWVRMSDVLDVRDGTHDSPQYQKSGIPMITSKNLVDGELDFSNVKYVSEEDAKIINSRSLVENDDILFAMIGSIGNPVLVRKEKEFVVKNVALFKKYGNSDISMDYIYWYLMREQVFFKKIVSGGLQPFISLKQFRSHVMPLPPLLEQKRIVHELEALKLLI